MAGLIADLFLAKILSLEQDFNCLFTEEQVSFTIKCTIEFPSNLILNRLPRLREIHSTDSLSTPPLNNIKKEPTFSLQNHQILVGEINKINKD